MTHLDAKNISVEALADLLQGTPRRGGVWSPRPIDIANRPRAMAQARRMLAAEELYQALSRLSIWCDANLNGCPQSLGEIQELADTAITLADKGV